MRDSGVCGVLVYCADYRCSHSVALSADRWPDDVVRYRAAVRLRCLRQTGCGGPAGFRLEYDPHNQELAQCLLEDYAKNRSFDRDRLLLACAQHTAVHRKYGDFLECGRRYGAGHGRCRSGLPRTMEALPISSREGPPRRCRMDGGATGQGLQAVSVTAIIGTGSIRRT